MHEQLCEIRIQHNNATVSKFKQLSSSLHTTFHRNGKIESLIFQPCSSQNGATPFYYETSSLIFKQRNAKIKRLNRQTIILYLYLKNIAENIYDNLCNILRPKDSHQNKNSGSLEMAFYPKISVPTHKFNFETTSEWEYWFLEEIFSIPAPPLLTQLYFCREALTISDCLSNLSCILSCHGVQSQLFLKEQLLKCWAPLVKRGWKRWHVLFILDS